MQHKNNPEQQDGCIECNIEIRLLDGGFAEYLSLKRNSYANWEFFKCSEVHFDELKTFIMCDLATGCIEVQLPTEMSSVTSLTLAIPGASVCVPGWSEQGELGVKPLSVTKGGSKRDCTLFPISRKNTLLGCLRAFWFPLKPLPRGKQPDSLCGSS